MKTLENFAVQNHSQFIADFYFGLHVHAIYSMGLLTIIKEIWQVANLNQMSKSIKCSNQYGPYGQAEEQISNKHNRRLLNSVNCKCFS